ncbi:MAG: vitamin K epoxide reductase family protein [Gemmatimonadetes bacterium]|nr:vitamin K epoxide reductase family protein [Gemmatimonadota bacterium]
MRHRMAVAVLALVGLLLSTYLLLYKLGFTGPLVCGAGGSCERVQTSQWGVFLGLPVAAYGVGGYLAILGVALLGLQERWQDRAEPTRWLAWLSGAGLAFTVYLKYLELFRIHAVCRWCVVSAVLITAIFGVSLAGLKKGKSVMGHA